MSEQIRVPLDAEAGHVAVAAFHDAIKGRADTELAVALACVAYVRHLEARRMSETYDVASGVRIHGLSRDEVQAAASALVYYGGDLGVQGDDAMARALSAARAWREVHEARHARVRDGGALADLAEARRRAALRLTVSGSLR